MVGVTAKLDQEKFRRSFARFTGPESRRPKQVVMRQQAKLFVRDVILVTPPNKNSKANRAGGEQTVRNDISRSVFAAPGRGNGLPEAAEIHRAARAKGRRGRVARSVDPTPARGAFTLLRKLRGHVGILASGWNAAAASLGASVPAFVKRHGTGFGSVQIKVSAASMQIRIANRVKFVSAVGGLERRMQWALNNRARQMDKQMRDHAIKKAARAADLAIK